MKTKLILLARMWFSRICFLINLNLKEKRFMNRLNRVIYRSSAFQPTCRSLLLSSMCVGLSLLVFLLMDALINRSFWSKIIFHRKVTLANERKASCLITAAVYRLAATRYPRYWPGTWICQFKCVGLSDAESVLQTHLKENCNSSHQARLNKSSLLSANLFLS